MSSKPLCPCCFKAYSSSIVSGEVTTDKVGSANFAFCGVCAPTDIEKALAKKAAASADSGELPVPPIVWYLTADEIQKAKQEILTATKANLDEIAQVPLDEVTFENTIQKLMVPSNYKTNPQVAACKFLQHCSTDPVIREAANQAGKDFSKSRVEGRMRKDVYERVKAFSINKNQTASLTEYQQHFVKAALEDFERAGLALSDEDGQKLKELLEEDANVCAEYGTNLGTDSTRLLFNKEELVGLSDDFIKDRVTEDGKVAITLKYPDIIPIGQTCQVASTRKQVGEAREGRGAYKNNLDLVARGITIRKEIATLLGYPSWAEYICTKRMSGSYQAVDEFLTNLQNKLTDAGKQDYKTLLDLKETHCQEIGIDFDGVLNAWDTSYYGNKLLKEKYGVDSETIKEYFPLDHVVETTLSIYQELLGLTFTELPKGTYWSWHTEVRCFLVQDTASKENIGHFYLDLHPRTGTYLL